MHKYGRRVAMKGEDGGRQLFSPTFEGTSHRHAKPDPPWSEEIGHLNHQHSTLTEELYSKY